MFFAEVLLKSVVIFCLTFMPKAFFGAACAALTFSGISARAEFGLYGPVSEFFAIYPLSFWLDLCCKPVAVGGRFYGRLSGWLALSGCSL